MHPTKEPHEKSDNRKETEETMLKNKIEGLGPDTRESATSHITPIHTQVQRRLSLVQLFLLDLHLRLHHRIAHAGQKIPLLLFRDTNNLPRLGVDIIPGDSLP